jgi:hypothetical protein
MRFTTLLIICTLYTTLSLPTTNTTLETDYTQIGNHNATHIHKSEDLNEGDIIVFESSAMGNIYLSANDGGCTGNTTECGGLTTTYGYTDNARWVVHKGPSGSICLQLYGSDLYILPKIDECKSDGRSCGKFVLSRGNKCTDTNSFWLFRKLDPEYDYKNSYFFRYKTKFVWYMIHRANGNEDIMNFENIECILGRSTCGDPNFMVLDYNKLKIFPTQTFRVYVLHNLRG